MKKPSARFTVVASVAGALAITTWNLEAGASQDARTCVIDLYSEPNPTLLLSGASAARPSDGVAVARAQMERDIAMARRSGDRESVEMTEPAIQARRHLYETARSGDPAHEKAPIAVGGRLTWAADESGNRTAHLDLELTPSGWFVAEEHFTVPMSECE